MADLLHGLLFRLTCAAAILFGVLALRMGAPRLILISNAALCIVALAVVVSYLPIVYAAFSARMPTRGDLLGLGIFISWLAQFLLRLISIIARDFGYPQIVNMHWLSAVIDLSLLGALLHLLAANAVEGNIPRKRWVRTGVVVAGGVGIVLLLLNLRTPITPPDFRPL